MFPNVLLVINGVLLGISAALGSVLLWGATKGMPAIVLGTVFVVCQLGFYLAVVAPRIKRRFKADLMDGRRTRNVLQGGSQLTSHMRTNAEQKPLQSFGSSHHEPHAHGVRRLRARRSGRPCSTFFL